MTTSESTPVRPSQTPLAEIARSVLTVLIAVASLVLVPVAAPFVTGICGATSFLSYRHGRRALWLVTTIICTALFALSILAILLSSSASYDVTSTSTSSS